MCGWLRKDSSSISLHYNLIFAAVLHFLTLSSSQNYDQIGEEVELRYILSGYGIDPDTLPISWTGNVKASLPEFLRKEDSSFSLLTCSTGSS